jgi:hypothetical protein
MRLLVKDAELSVEQIAQTVRDLESVLALANTGALNLSELTREILGDLHARLQTTGRVPRARGNESDVASALTW